MEYAWLNQRGEAECILFLSGWGMDPNPFLPIAPGNFDILMGYDYRELVQPDLSQLARYERVHLVTWSMGVWVGGHLLHGAAELFTTRTAVAGTVEPVHPTLGIPTEAYLELERAFSATELAEFHNSMFTDQRQCDQFSAHKPHRDLFEVHQELIEFRHRYEKLGASPDIYTHKIVTTRDRVFPLKNQRRAWGKNNVIVSKLPHFPFYSLENWPRIIEKDLSLSQLKKSTK